jgi:AcrR family transcriptional regulator
MTTSESGSAKTRPKHDVPAPGHRTQLRRNARRDKILDCALAVFARQGFHETSIAAICAQAHIARGTLHQYFKDKRDVLAALIDRIVSRIIDARSLNPAGDRVRAGDAGGHSSRASSAPRPRGNPPSRGAPRPAPARG